MAKVLVIGDSQAGNPGAAAKRVLDAHGHDVVQVHNDGQSPIVYARAGGDLWNQYTGLAADRDIVLLIFGHNSQAGAATRNALIRMRDGVRAPVFMSGPPQYPNADDQAIGAALRTQNQGVFGDRYIDAWPSTPPSLPRDRPGWHLTAAAAQGWGAAMAAALERALVSGTVPARQGGAPTRPFGADPMMYAAAAVASAAVLGVIAVFVTRRRRSAQPAAA